jgi:hypothetical protein
LARKETRGHLPATTRDARRFNLAVVGVDCMIAHDGAPRLLEVNHIPDVTVFAPIRDAFLALAAAWCADPRTDWPHDGEMR